MEVITTSQIIEDMKNNLIFDSTPLQDQIKDNELRSKIGFVKLFPDWGKVFTERNYRFISKLKWTHILKKYDLLEGDFNRYIHPIPLDVLEDLNKKISEINEKGPYYFVCSSFRSLGDHYSQKYTKQECEDFIEKEKRRLGWRSIFYNGKIHSNRLGNFKIAAPKSHFDLTNSEVNEKNEIINLDPIVVLSLNEGVLLIKSWDVEQFIPEVAGSEVTN